MSDYLTVILLDSMLLIAAFFLLTAAPALSKRLTAVAGVLALTGGLVLYGYGYISTIDSLPPAVLRTVMSVCRMFIGDSDFADVSSAALFRNLWASILFWVFQLLAFYATSSMAISLAGSKVLRRARLRLNRRKPISVIYGINQDSVAFGQELRDTEKCLVAFVGEDADESLAARIGAMDCVLRTDPNALSGNVKFLKSIGIRKGKRAVTLYALDKDYTHNLRYARSFLDALLKRGLAAEQLALTALAPEDDTVRALQVSPEQPGYGFVTVFQEHWLAARLLVQNYPPCHYVSFGKTGKAESDFSALIVGFGQLGQAVLRNLVMNGQFVGSTFRAAVFAPDCQQVSGNFTNCFQGVLDHYDIRFHPYDGRSREMYDYIRSCRDELKYIVLSTGSQKRNTQIEEELRPFLNRLGMSVPIFQCSEQGVKFTPPNSLETIEHRIYTTDVLSMRKLDKMAMLVNQHYQGKNSQGALRDWMACDFFSRMSCRAFADFIEAILCAAGKTRQEATRDAWHFSKEHLDTLSQMEHMRWCAFHFCMGFLPMSQQEYSDRMQTYLAQVQETGSASIRVGKNMPGRTHACLVSWDELDALSRKESQYRKTDVNYKQMDTENVMIIPAMLEAASVARH